MATAKKTKLDSVYDFLHNLGFCGADHGHGPACTKRYSVDQHGYLQVFWQGVPVTVLLDEMSARAPTYRLTVFDNGVPRYYWRNPANPGGYLGFCLLVGTLSGGAGASKVVYEVNRTQADDGRGTPVIAKNIIIPSNKFYKVRAFWPYGEGLKALKAEGKASWGVRGTEAFAEGETVYLMQRMGMLPKPRPHVPEPKEIDFDA